MRNIMIILLSFFSFKSFGQLVQDGPYLLYKDNQLVLKSVIDDQPNEQVFDLKQKKELKISVNFKDNAAWNFTVGLKPEIKNEPSITAMPEKLFVLSDIEGEFEGFRALLLANGIIDEQYNWKFGKGHMVICGDLFDRGAQVPECLWLLYKLEQSAKAAGGYVHTLLGNHDIMNLSADLRYLRPKYPKSAEIMGVDYMALYNDQSELGRWLRSKNTIEKVGDYLFLHAGIAPQITELKMPIEEINLKCRPFYDKAKKLDGLPNLADASISKFFQGATSLFWYRGYFAEPKATEAEVDATLALYKCKSIVVGHTIVAGNVGFYYGGKVLGLDVNQHAGDHQAALLEKGKWYKVNDKGLKVPL